jgi:tRNA(fMet)-specific endonuclease VapC
MHLLDTDHMSVLRRGGAEALRLQQRLEAVPDEEIVTCIVVYEEQTRGWKAEVARMQSGSQFTLAYDSLATNLSIYCSMTLLPFDARAATVFDQLKRQKIRIGTQDLKIASIALANDAILLTRNARDFARVPALKFEDWTL